MSAVLTPDWHPGARLGDARTTRPAVRRVDDTRGGPSLDDAASRVCVTEHEFFLAGHGPAARTGILLIHGLTGTPNEMRVLGKGLARAGFTVYAVQLAGHCGSDRDLLASRWQDWTASVHAGAARLAREVDRVVTMGLSIGAVLALEVASEPRAGIAAVGALSTMFRYDGWSMPLYTRLSFLLKAFRLVGIGRRSVFMERPPYGIKDEALRKRIVARMHAGDSAAAGLPGNPWYSVIEAHDLSRHVRSRLDRITQPCLVVHAAEDDIASADNARLVARRVQGPVELVLLEDSYHMITVDRERRTVIAKAADFARRVAEAG